MVKKQRMNLKQIAEATDLSITTVSRVLRNKGEISESTRKRVLKAAKQMNYRPNLLIRGIQTGMTHNIGVMVPPYNPYWSNVLKGIHNELVKADYAPITLWEDADSTMESNENFILQQMHRLIDRRVDGVILWPKVSEVYGTHLDELESRDLPVVTIDHQLDFADSVETDEQLGAERIVKHLHRLGHRKIAHLGGDCSLGWAKARRACFETSASEFPDIEYIIEEVVYDEDVPEMARSLLMSKFKPTAVFAFSDWAAFEVYNVAVELGVHIPEQLSVVGYSDTHRFAKLINPPLTTIKQRPYEIGAKAAEILLERIEGKRKNDKLRHIKMGCELVVRKSTDKVIQI